MWQTKTENFLNKVIRYTHCPTLSLKVILNRCPSTQLMTIIFIKNQQSRGYKWIVHCLPIKVTFPKTGQTASWKLFPDQGKTTTSWMDSPSSQCRTLLENSWNVIVSGETCQRPQDREMPYSLQIREREWGSDQESADGKMQLCLHIYDVYKGSQKKNKWWL